MTETKDMFEQISAILTDKKDKPFSYEELAAMLKTDPDALKTFDEVYKTQVLESGELHENMLQWDTATVKAILDKMHEDILNQRYHESVQTVLAELKKVIPRIELTGQWSVDVMRNGNDYYIIDMALAENSALNDCVPKNLLRAYPQQWLPGESNS